MLCYYSFISKPGFVWEIKICFNSPNIKKHLKIIICYSNTKPEPSFFQIVPHSQVKLVNIQYNSYFYLHSHKAHINIQNAVRSADFSTLLTMRFLKFTEETTFKAQLLTCYRMLSFCRVVASPLQGQMV